MEWLLHGPDGAADLLGQVVVGPLVELARKSHTEHWAVAGGYEGVEHAQLVVVNIRSEAERQRGEQLVADVGRLRTDPALFDAILGRRGSRIPVTAVVANLADPRDAGTKKAVARVRRALRTRP